ncbi:MULTISPECIES: hypothetical protein [Thiorhodovibrio]|uniref:hypothetical protein n=1 Tax=Thiorhodovibrio TaxID=61593 RepID=UPI001912DF5B|nr:MULTISPECIES: hypothetical protein [Thiorhodovibrio]MBK5970376.1 hypothetical protein [Thiorhodovibrio winogradskyi]WPL14320.1 hypothetical protein Thiosp_04163 [Thiorhodovibrio litoralis]
MGFLFAALWCLAFAVLAVAARGKLRKYRHYQPFTGEVVKVHTVNGRWQAVVRPDDAQLRQRIGDFGVTFNDMGDYQEGQPLSCLWDGRNPVTACEDERGGARMVIFISIGAIAFMIIASIAMTVLVEMGIVTVAD